MKKRVRKSPLSASEKTVICNIYKLVEEMWPKDQFLYKNDIANKTAETSGVHVSTVYKVLRKQVTTKQVRSPTPAPKRLTTVDKLELSGIRRILH
ncbi:hypothetical protein EVAR_76135_1 [Eumeta japonica]|uniref:Uncharacterized protein n=1 Tax=Eumeta variegata TaxID=151549 RepID=A0A4C1UX81_EUMVA|nr:hypothetical protein EVAR_76135_1 [Eumeta japonica]